MLFVSVRTLQTRSRPERVNKSTFNAILPKNIKLLCFLFLRLDIMFTNFCIFLRGTNAIGIRRDSNSHTIRELCDVISWEQRLRVTTHQRVCHSTAGLVYTTHVCKHRSCVRGTQGHTCAHVLMSQWNKPTATNPPKHMCVQNLSSIQCRNLYCEGLVCDAENNCNSCSSTKPVKIFLHRENNSTVVWVWDLPLLLHWSGLS